MTGKVLPCAGRPGFSLGGRRALGSLVSLSALAWATAAAADTSITDARTTPVATSTANAGAPDNVAITSSGSVKPGSGIAVTLDSDNSITNAGVIQIRDASDATGILARGGHAGSVTNSATVQVDETTTFSDTDGDGIVDGPFATGARRYGIRVVGAAPLTGGISNDAAGAIAVQGDDSAGISVETGLVGSISNLGSITVTGSRDYGLHATGPISGGVTIGGSISATGQGSQAAVLEGDVQGAVVVQGALVATGYRTTTRPAADVLAKLQAEDLLQGGPALAVSSSVSGGLLVDTTGAVYSYGAAPAIVVGSASHAISLSNNSISADAYPYGVEINGAVGASGVYDGVSATGVRFGVGGGGVTTGGGVRVSGAITASAYAADATGLTLGRGATAPLIHNEGTISATLLSDAQAAARAVSIEAGANVQDLQNSLTISATAIGQKGDAVAVVDRSGTLSSIENTRTISATIAPTDTLATVTGRAIALDLSANTTGVRITQTDVSDGATLPSILGEVLLGSGADRLDILAGTLAGDLSLGAGTNALTIDGGASVTGRLTADGGTLALSVANGSLQVNNAGVLHLTSLDLSGASTLVLTADPANGGATALDVAGSATIASGAKIGLRFDSLLTGSATYTLVRADQLSVGTIDSSLLGTFPYVYSSSLQVSPEAGTVAVTVARKSASDLQLPAATASAYEPMIEALDRDAGVRDAVLAQTSRAGLVGLYNHMLPNRSGSVFQVAAAGAEAFARPLDDRQDAAGGGFWVQEVNVGLVADSQADLPGYKAWGLGFVGGYEVPIGGLGVAGLTLGANSNQIDDDGAAANAHLVANLVEAGAYWRTSWHGFAANARVAGDYLSVSSDRVVVAVDNDGINISRTARGRWSGTGLSARLAASYERRWDSLYLRPQANLSYMRLTEGAYAETGGGDAIDFTVDSRTSSRLSGFAGLAVGALFGDDVSWGPELLLGYRTVASEQLGATTARFTSGGDRFALAADEVGGQGFAAHLSFKGETGGGGFVVDVGTEMRDGLAIYDLRLAAHFQF